MTTRGIVMQPIAVDGETEVVVYDPEDDQPVYEGPVQAAGRHLNIGVHGGSFVYIDARGTAFEFEVSFTVVDINTVEITAVTLIEVTV